ncbi:macrophage mannose receptor 1-like [Branchiostoma floridae]|uniref:Macrophage mannose receptor 1-like n=1 Tax=Branchiostoma floridae TaxID=7739 RepID=A0A9J7LVD1_BRAFL|nr:macrophage mannose receptor 1-like [Branchiostoma floridae]
MTSTLPPVTPTTKVTATLTALTTTMSSVTTTMPGETTKIPAVTTTVPAVITTLPAVTTTLPAVTTTLPAVTTTLPAVTTTLSGVTTKIPAVTTTVPAVTNTLPVATTIPLEVTSKLPDMTTTYKKYLLLTTSVTRRRKYLETTKQETSTYMKGFPGYTERSGTWYKVVAVSMTYVAAAQTCAADGGRLAVVKSQDVQDFLVAMIAEVNAGTDYWIGLLQMTGGWTWSDGTAVNSGFTNWAPGEPNNVDEQCGQLLQVRGFKWDDTRCYYQKHFVCQIGKGNLAIGKTATQSSDFVHLGEALGAGKAVDGSRATDIKPGKACTHTENEYQPWWKVDLSRTYTIKQISILNRGDCCGERLKNFMVRVGPNEDFAQNDQCGEMYTGTPEDGQTIVVYCSPPIPGRYVSVQLMGREDNLSLCEVEVYAETGTCGLSAFRHVPRTDCYGSDISRVTGVTLQDCAEACCADSTCLSFQYNIGIECYVKSRLCSDEEKVSLSSGNMYDRIHLPACHNGYQIHNNICYKAFNMQMTFLDASWTCRTEGGSLAMPKDAGTDDFLVSLKKDVDERGRFRFGLADRRQEGVWEWVDGTPLGGYSAWMPGEPNNDNDEDCVLYYDRKTNDGKTWNDDKCSSAKKFICEVKLPAPMIDNCQVGYKLLARTCIRIYFREVGHKDARKICETDGATLAMPKTEELDQALRSFVHKEGHNAQFWIGLRNKPLIFHKLSKRHWIWEDGSTLGYYKVRCSRHASLSPNRNRFKYTFYVIVELEKL